MPARAPITAASPSWPRSTTWPAWRPWRRQRSPITGGGGARPSAAPGRPCACSVGEAVSEAFDLGGDDGQVGLLGFALGLARHLRDHACERIEQLLLEVDEVAVHRHPSARLFQRLRPWIFILDRSLEIGALPSRPSSLLSPGGHGYILFLFQSEVTTDHVEFHRGGLYYQTRSCLAPPGPGRAGASAGPRLRRTDHGSHPSPSRAAPCADAPVQGKDRAG